jgi:molecular chaperone GrpE
VTRVTNKEVDEEVKEQKTVDNEAENTADKEEPEVIEEAEVVEENPVDEKDEEINRLTEALNAEEAKYLKLLAEFENFKRRNKQEIDTNNKYRDQKFAEDLLPVLDNMERALSIEGDSESFTSLKKGVEMVYNDFSNAFYSHDITEIKSVGEVFDPNFHQAVMTEPSDEESGIVIEEFQKGYVLKDRVLRPSMVKVSE